MKFYNICSKQEYQKKDGTKKINWLKVGTVKEFDDGRKFISLNIVPNESFYVFEINDKPAEAREAILEEAHSAVSEPLVPDEDVGSYDGYGEDINPQF